MSKEIYINVSPHEKRVAILENKKIEDFSVERSDYVNLVGNIYKGRVESVLPGMQAAFVNIGLEKNGFLYVGDIVAAPAEYEKMLNGADYEQVEVTKKKRLPPITQLLKKGDEVVVQVVKEPIGTCLRMSSCAR